MHRRSSFRRCLLPWKPNWDGSMFIWVTQCNWFRCWISVKLCILFVCQFRLKHYLQETQILPQLTSLKTPSPSRMNQWPSTAVTRTTRSSWQPVALETAVQEVAQPLVPRFAPRETVLATVRYPLSRKPTRLEDKEDCQKQQGPHMLSDGARPAATFGGTKDVVTTQSANRREKVVVGGWTTSQVSFTSESTFSWLSHYCKFVNCRHPPSLWQLNNSDPTFSGKTCPLPGSLPHGNWSCEMQEIPIHGTPLLEEDAQSYPG